MQVEEYQPLSISRRHNVPNGATTHEDSEATYQSYHNTSYNASSYGPEKALPAPITASHAHSQNVRSNPLSRFGKSFWTSRKVWPRIVYILTAFILVIIWVNVMLAFAEQEVKAQERNKNLNSTKGSDRQPRDLYMKGTLKKFDPIERALTVAWGLTYLDKDNTTLLPMGDSEGMSASYAIYRDVKVVNDDRPISDNLTAIIEASFGVSVEGRLGIDNVTQPPIAILGQHPFDSVDTSIDFQQAVEENPWKQPLFGYPFDEWAGSIVFAAVDKGLADMSNLSNSWALPLSGAVLSDSTLNWRMTLAVNNTCLFDGEFAGCELHLDFIGKRPDLVRFAAILAIIVNWLSTIGIFLLTSEAAIMGRLHILTETDIMGVCFTALFALPSVRVILPGAPDFGAIIDLIGIIPNIIIISICTTMMAISKVMTRRPKAE
ncbi:hypothetical protein FRC14_008007 [Serendipita sp. 396]|nr:hypothetical protein FRC14_008007 [Serendipita sp. 396]KAG8777282.1 hypothetical protein FRC15_011431 [Serendipita sp. 397]KAG8793101.1 hypothetical protein FRC16_011142 [Serendipita sp. 398]KAG8859941.1 hypothetical protein FRC20_011742 [Serendipita sp. 405]